MRDLEASRLSTHLISLELLITRAIETLSAAQRHLRNYASCSRQKCYEDATRHASTGGTGGGCPPAPKILEGRGGAEKFPFEVRLNCLTPGEHLCEHTALCLKKVPSCPLQICLAPPALTPCRRPWMLMLPQVTKMMNLVPRLSRHINNCRTQLQ